VNIVEGRCYHVGLGFADWFKRVRAWLATRCSNHNKD
jgi:hypothetical protein